MILAIYGYGGLGHEVADNAKCLNKQSNRWSSIIFIDDNAHDDKKNIFTFENFIKLYKYNEVEVVIGVGEPSVRKKLFQKIQSAGYKFATIIHPTACISETAKIGAGVVIGCNSFISSFVNICDNAYIQPFVAIGHDSEVGECSVLSTNVAIAGHCKIGEQTYIGLNVPVKENVNIGSQSIVGMGSVVVRDIPDCVIALGNPARPMKNNDNNKVFN